MRDDDEIEVTDALTKQQRKKQRKEKKKKRKERGDSGKFRESSNPNTKGMDALVIAKCRTYMRCHTLNFYRKRQDGGRRDCWSRCVFKCPR